MATVPNGQTPPELRSVAICRLVLASLSRKHPLVPNGASDELLVHVCLFPLADVGGGEDQGTNQRVND